jgi:hypothetical protein
LLANRDDAKQAHQVAQAELNTAQESREGLWHSPPRMKSQEGKTDGNKKP